MVGREVRKPGGPAVSHVGNRVVEHEAQNFGRRIEIDRAAHPRRGRGIEISLARLGDAIGAILFRQQSHYSEKVAQNPHPAA